MNTKDMTEAGFLNHISGFVDSGSGRARELVDLGVELAVITSRIQRVAVDANSDCLSVRHAIHERTAPTTPAKPSPPVSVLPFVVVGVVCLLIGADCRSEKPMTARPHHAASEILNGKAAMLKGDYAEAIKCFQAAGADNAAHEAYLPPMIECYLATQQYDMALMLCAELDAHAPRNQSLVPYFRGAAHYGIGNRIVAKGFYVEARTLGHPGAADALKAMGG